MCKYLHGRAELNRTYSGETISRYGFISCENYRDEGNVTGLYQNVEHKSVGYHEQVDTSNLSVGNLVRLKFCDRSVRSPYRVSELRGLRENEWFVRLKPMHRGANEVLAIFKCKDRNSFRSYNIRGDSRFDINLSDFDGIHGDKVSSAIICEDIPMCEHFGLGDDVVHLKI